MTITHYGVMPGSMADYLFRMTPGITIDMSQNASIDPSVHDLSKYRLVASQQFNHDGTSTITFHR